MGLGKRNIVISAAFPPPLHGLSKISHSIASDLAKLADVHRFDLSSRSLARSPVYHLRRLWAVLIAAGGILRNGLRPNPCLYIPADGGLGLVYTLFLTALARASGQAIFIHHHSFSAIDRRQLLMSVLVSVAGRRATHIFLCQLMQRRFRDNYSGEWRGVISSNVVHVPATSEMPSRATGRITVGLLSNLTQEKGLHLFLDLLRACQRRGVPVRGLLAGPIENSADAVMVEAARSEIGEHLSYLGPLYGAEKNRFLSELDIFVFPTRYRNEAQPNAVFEAMSAGAAVVVFARGCLGEDVSSDCGVLVEPSADFISAACEQFARWNEDRAALAAAKTAARQRFAECKAAAVEGYQQLLLAIADREPPARL
ncbi:glycosyltransferase family 4 protein [Bradyrhizobium sp. CB82]|uniref:glycosyltransferase family 4 protein n=1 Tax=Bradyrhizobium sp. CB82 TaxID=3039159 RepID=UPI0024B23E56|nr:glycosyltransferase family 4 protein [Bradyrhizobium sp. CB82]WFU45214.1 glycosyltransferase family 4 protein [Bradyrhizobium sp. CB82]